MNPTFPKGFQHGHEPESIATRLKLGSKPSYLRDFVYGSIDGTITTFAVVSGVVGADLPYKVILILGMANLLADGFSMAASNYLGTKTENQERDLLQNLEDLHIDKFPEGEKMEIRQILINKGFSGELLEKNIGFYTNNRERWINLMLSEEYGISNLVRSAHKAAIVTFLAFVFFGTIPLISYVLRIQNPYFWSSILAGLSFGLIGSLKSKWTIENAFISASKTFAVGALASIIAYSIGSLLKSIT